MEEKVCNACGFEESFCPEGMMTCERCQTVHYCSLDCLQWDWKSGGHANVCADVRSDAESSSSELEEMELALHEQEDSFSFKDDYEETLDRIQEETEGNDEPELRGSWRSRTSTATTSTDSVSPTLAAGFNAVAIGAAGVPQDADCAPSEDSRTSLKSFQSALQEEMAMSDHTRRRASLKDFQNIYVTGGDNLLPKDEASADGSVGLLQELMLHKEEVSSDDSARLQDELSCISSDNSALKTSINKALRDYEALYGKEAAADAVTKLTSDIEDSEVTPVTVESEGTPSSYNGYRNSLFERTRSKENVPELPTSLEKEDFAPIAPMKPEDNPIKQSGVVNNAEVVTVAMMHQQPNDNDEQPPRYLAYRSSLVKPLQPQQQQQPGQQQQQHMPLHVPPESPRIVSSSEEEEEDDSRMTPTRGRGYANYRSSLAQSVDAPLATDSAASREATVETSDSSSFYSRYRQSLAQRVSAMSGAGAGSIRQEALEDALDAESDSDPSSDSDGDEEILKSRLATYLDKDSKGTGEGPATRSIRNESSQRSVSETAWSARHSPLDDNESDSVDEEMDAVTLTQEMIRREQSRKVGIAVQAGKDMPQNGKDLDRVQQRAQVVDNKVVDDEVFAGDEEAAMDHSKQRSLSPSAAGCFVPKKDGSSTEPNRKRNVLIGAALFIGLVVLPLGLGLGIGLSNNENQDRVVPGTSSPTNSPTALSPTASPVAAPTKGPSVRTDSPTGVFLSSLPTAAPVETETPTLVPTTNAPTLVPTTNAPTNVPSTSEPTDGPTLAPSTLTPTLPPTLTDQALFDVLASVSSDGGEAILTTGTPQNRAYLWLAEDSQQRRLQATDDAATIQRYAMATFFYATEGDLWIDRTLWLSNFHVCEWYSKAAESCNGSDEVVVLDLGLNGVGGQLPPEIGLLTRLERLDLTGNTRDPRLGGPVPSEIGKLVDLSFVSLQNNILSGSLSESSFSGLFNLETLDLRQNELTGPIPTSIGSLAALTEINVSQNNLSGEMPASLGQLTSLQWMDLSQNALSGPIPNDIGQATMLQSLRLNHNKLTSIPLLLGRLLRLQTLEIYENELQGPLTHQIGQLRSLRLLDLHGNKLGGQIPPAIGLLQVSLRELDLSDNSFLSTIPTEIGDLGGLFKLQLQSNQLTGQVPSSLSNLSLLSLIRIDDNNLDGVVPDEVCEVFSDRLPQFYLDCGGSPPEVICPPGTCCTYCCEDGVGCECVYAGTGFEFLC